MIDSKHKNADNPEIQEALRLESGWGEVDNCWGQLGYINIMLYRPPEYSDIVPVWQQDYNKNHSRFSPERALFRAERNADLTVRPQLMGDLIAVALRNAGMPFVDSSALYD